MSDTQYNMYLLWLKNTHNLTPEDVYCGVNALTELKSLRDEHLGLLGETQLVKMLKAAGLFEQQPKKWEKYKILTFEEYKTEINKTNETS